MKLTNTVVLVTGGAGSIGSNLIKRLLEENCGNIIVLDDLSSGFRNNISLSNPRIKFIEGSITDKNSLEAAFSDAIEYIFHLAGHFANQSSVNHPKEDLTTNALGTLMLLEKACSLKKLKRFLYASSSCVYAASEKILTEESQRAPHTPYAISKLAGEHYVSFFQHHYGMPTTILRYFNVYGPGEHPGKYRNVIPNFIDLALRQKPLPITGDGTETRTFTFIDDAVEGTIQAALNDTAKGKDFNISSETEMEILVLSEKINKLTGNRAGLTFLKPRHWDNVRRRITSIKKANATFGYQPTTSIDVGLSQTLSWFKEWWREQA